MKQSRKKGEENIKKVTDDDICLTDDLYQDIQLKEYSITASWPLSAALSNICWRISKDSFYHQAQNYFDCLSFVLAKTNTRP